MPEPPTSRPRLIITADDWGYSPSYNEGILEAANAGAIDAAGAMVLRPFCDPAALVATGIEIGLHLEVAADAGEEAREEPGRQTELFEQQFGQPPAYIDGHHHCHSCPPAVAAAVESLAVKLGVPVRAVDEQHRERLATRGIACTDRLIGRLAPADAALPLEVKGVLAGDGLPAGTTEWMVHPGHPDPGSGSRYDQARAEDLALLLDLAREVLIVKSRATHRGALT
jgi:predicted glycoside hydrolase/deacetylase ChbG (UPF0249 family)